MWPHRALGQQRSEDPKSLQKLLGLLIALSLSPLSLLLSFSVEQKQKFRNVTESEYKNVQVYIMLPRHTEIHFFLFFFSVFFTMAVEVVSVKDTA